jgi:hypothetical protein
MGNVVSNLIIKLVDQVSGPASKAAASIKEVDKAAASVGKSAAGADKLAKSVKDISTAAKALNVDWSKGFSDELQKLGLGAKKIDEVKKSWKELVATIGSSKNLMASMPKLDQWEKDTLGHLRRVKKEVARDEHGRMREGNGRFAEGGGGMGGIIPMARGMIGPLAGAYGVYKAGKFVTHEQADYQREKYRGTISGMTPTEIAESVAKASQLSGKYQNIDQKEIMEHQRKLRGTLGDWHHAQDFVESIVQAQSILSSGPGGSDGATRDLDQITKGLEGAGYAANPDKFGRMLNAFVKGKNLFGETLTGEDFRTYLQRSKTSKFGLSEDYMANVVPTMLQHEGANQFGTAQATAFNSLVGQRQTAAAKEKLRKFGILDKKDKLIGQQDFVANPYEWAKKYLAPKMEKAGMSLDTEAGSAEREKAVDFLMKGFSNRNAGEFFASMLANRKVIEKDKPMLAKAQGLEAADKVTQNDPYQAWNAVVAQTKNLAQNIFEGSTAVTTALNGLAAGLNFLADFVKGDWFKKVAPEDKKAIEQRQIAGPEGFMGGTDTPEETAAILKRQRDEEAAAREKLRAQKPNDFTFGSMAKPAEAGAAGAESGSGFRSGLNSELQAAEEDVAASVGRMLNMLNFNATPSVSPKVNAPAGAPAGSAPGKQSARETSTKLGALIDNHTRGSFHDHEFG